MKKHILLLVILLVPWTLSAQSLHGNYISTQLPISSADTLTTIEYYDGLGRSRETVKKGFSSNGNKDLLALTEYDGMDNKYRCWNSVPFPCTGEEVLGDEYYVTCRKAYGDPIVFTKYEFERKQNGRVVKETGPGYLWTTFKKSKNFQYEGNIAIECPKFQLLADGKSFLFRGYYQPGTLNAIKETDEDGVSVSKYYDILGKLIMEKHGENAITYYIYDSTGNLTFVLPPSAYEACMNTKGASRSITSDDILKKYAYYYAYDGKNRCIERKLPGCEPVKMIYDKENKLIFKQDGNQRKNNEWTFMLFDSKCRPTVYGVCKDADKINISNKNVTSFFSTSGTYAMYNANITLDVMYLLKAKYYDNYNFLKNTGYYSFQSQDGYDKDIEHNDKSVSTSGLLTGDKTYELSDNHTCYTEALYYNNKGDLVQSRRDNNLLGIDDVYYQRNPYTGKVCKEKTVHSVGMKVKKNCGNAIETIIKRYTYDKDGRLDSMTYKLNNRAEFLVKHYQYDDLGRVAATTSHSRALDTHYSYNVRGQQTAANCLLAQESIFYNKKCHEGQVPLAYNGNISAVEWKYKKGNTWNDEAFEYEYDKQNRLTSALSTTIDEKNNMVFGNHDTHYSYDNMGNITDISRKSINIDDSIVGYRDDATLTYDGNQLSHITNKGFIDSSRDTKIADKEYSNATEFAYDANGNMTRNLNKGIIKITYNVLNLPEYIYMKNNEFIHNVYDADGNKLSMDINGCIYDVKIPESGSVQGELDSINITHWTGTGLKNYSTPIMYSGDFVYKTATVKKDQKHGTSVPSFGDEWEDQLELEKIDFGEGYLQQHLLLNAYDYIKDHLGNIRFLVQNGKIVQANNYYPYGGFYSDDSNEYQYRWRFGGKELNRKVDIYDWGFRNYDPTNGMFATIDPMCELNYSMTPYSFANNNPINYTDLFGLKTYSWEEFVKNWQDFDVKNDDVELPNVVCIGAKPKTCSTYYDNAEDQLGTIKDYSSLVYKLNLEYGESNLSQPLWNMSSFIKHNSNYLNQKLHLSTFHPSYIYRGINKGVNKIAEYGKIAGRVSVSMKAIEIAYTGEIQPSDVWDTTIPTILGWIPGYGWAIAGGYLILDTGVELYTGKSIGEHLNDYVREQHGINSLNIYSFTFK